MKKILTKDDIIKLVIKGAKTRVPISAHNCKIIMNRFFFEVNRALLEKRTVGIRDFGKFTVYKGKPRSGRNQFTHKKLVIPARWRIKYKPSENVLKILREE